MGRWGTHIDFEPLQVRNSVRRGRYALLTDAGLVIHTATSKSTGARWTASCWDVRRFAELGRDRRGVPPPPTRPTPSARVQHQRARRGRIVDCGIFAGRWRKGRSRWPCSAFPTSTVYRACCGRRWRHRKIVMPRAAPCRPTCGWPWTWAIFAVRRTSFVDPEAAAISRHASWWSSAPAPRGSRGARWRGLALGEHPMVQLRRTTWCPLHRVIPQRPRDRQHHRSPGARGCRVLSGSSVRRAGAHQRHAFQGEQRMMIDLVRPRSFVPNPRRVPDAGRPRPHGGGSRRQSPGLRDRGGRRRGGAAQDEIVAVVPHAVSCRTALFDARGASPTWARSPCATCQLLRRRDAGLLLRASTTRAARWCAGRSCFGKGAPVDDRGSPRHGKRRSMPWRSWLPLSAPIMASWRRPCAARYARCGRRAGEAADGGCRSSVSVTCRAFDIVSKVNEQEWTTPFKQAKKEIDQRYDFKGTETSLEKVSGAREGA